MSVHEWWEGGDIDFPKSQSILYTYECVCVYLHFSSVQITVRSFVMHMNRRWFNQAYSILHQR